MFSETSVCATVHIYVMYAVLYVLLAQLKPEESCYEG